MLSLGVWCQRKIVGVPCEKRVGAALLVAGQRCPEE